MTTSVETSFMHDLEARRAIEELVHRCAMHIRGGAGALCCDQSRTYTMFIPENQA